MLCVRYAQVANRAKHLPRWCSASRSCAKNQ